MRSDGRRAESAPAAPTAPKQPQVDDATAGIEREVLKIAIQLPGVAGPQFDALTPDAFLVDRYRIVCTAIIAAGGSAAGTSGPAWTAAISGHVADERIRNGVHALAVEPLRAEIDARERYAGAVMARMHEVVAGRQIAMIKGRLQRINPQDEPDEHARLFGELIALESYRRGQRERAIGDS